MALFTSHQKMVNHDELLIFENEVTDFFNKYEHVLLTGDANAHVGLLQDYSV